MLLVGVITYRPESGVKNNSNSQFVNSVRCDPADTGFTVPSDGSAGSFGTLLFDPICPVTDDMT